METSAELIANAVDTLIDMKPTQNKVLIVPPSIYKKLYELYKKPFWYKFYSKKKKLYWLKYKRRMILSFRTVSYPKIVSYNFVENTKE